MTIDEVIEKHKIMKKASKLHNDKRGVFYSVEEHEQLTDWLKELKFLKQWKFDVVEEFCKFDCNSVEEVRCNTYSKAIDDFAEKIKSNERLGYVGCLDKIVDEIAEQLKGDLLK